MSMKKQDRKESYGKIISAMGKGDNREAWDLITLMMGNDVGVFVMADYDKVIEANKAKDA